MENIRTQIDNDKVRNYVELTKNYAKVFRHTKSRDKMYQDVVRDFKRDIGMLKGLELQEYILIILKECPENLGKLIEIFPTVDLLIKTINRNIAKNISNTAQ